MEVKMKASNTRFRIRSFKDLGSFRDNLVGFRALFRRNEAPTAKTAGKKSAHVSLWGIVGLGGISMLCIGVILLSVVGVAILDPSLFSGMYHKAPEIVQPALEPFRATPTNIPDVIGGGGTPDTTGKALDSQCPVGAPTITIKRGPYTAGTREWFDALPDEPQDGIAICVYTEEYNAFLVKTGTYRGGILDGKRLTGLDVLAYFYSYGSVGSDTRITALKTALSTVKPGKLNGAEMKDTGWVTLPGYSRPSDKTTPPPLCPAGNCFEATPDPTNTPTPTPFQPMQITATLTPMPTSMFTPTAPYIQMEIVPTLVRVTPQPPVATAMSNVSADEWLELYEDARLFEGQHCQHIYRDLQFQTMSTSQLWAYTQQLTWTNGQFGWQVWGNRRDVYVPEYGNYVVYSVCGQVANVPSTSNIDGNGTTWNGGVSMYYPPGQPDPTTGLIDAGNGFVWVNVYGMWLSPATPKLTLGQYETLQPYEAITRVNGWDNAFNEVIAVNAGDFPSSSDTRVLMYVPSTGEKFWVNFNVYLSNINTSAGGTLKLVSCPASGGYVFAGNNASGNWCIVPGN